MTCGQLDRSEVERSWYQRAFRRAPYPLVVYGLTVCNALYWTIVRRRGAARWPEVVNPARYLATLPASLRGARHSRAGGPAKVYRSLLRLEFFGYSTAIATFSNPRTRERYVQTSGRRYLERAVAERRPVILVTPHIGSPFALIADARLLAVPVATLVYRPGRRLQSIADWVDRLVADSRAGSHELLDCASPSGAFTLVRLLKDAAVVCWSPDFVQGYATSTGGIPCDFLEQHLEVSPLLVDLAMRFDALVVLGVARLTWGVVPRVAISYEPLDLSGATAEERMQCVFGAVEASILENVDQWVLWKNWQRPYDDNWAA